MGCSRREAIGRRRWRGWRGGPMGASSRCVRGQRPARYLHPACRAARLADLLTARLLTGCWQGAAPSGRLVPRRACCCRRRPSRRHRRRQLGSSWNARRRGLAASVGAAAAARHRQRRPPAMTARCGVPARSPTRRTRCTPRTGARTRRRHRHRLRRGTRRCWRHHCRHRDALAWGDYCAAPCAVASAVASRRPTGRRGRRLRRSATRSVGVAALAKTPRAVAGA